MKPKILTTLAEYDRGLFLSDLVAALTVALVAIPLSIAIAIASGADPAKGLVTAIIGGFLISALGGSRVQIGGPTGAFIVVVFGVIAEHGYDGLVLATMMAGAILLIAGYLRAGNLISYIPESVVNGFTIGIAVIIGASQIKDFLGLEMAQQPADLIEKLPAIWNARYSAGWHDVAIGAGTMALIIFLRRAAPKFPGLIIAVAISSAMVAIWHMPVDTIASRFGELPRQLPTPAMPDISRERMILLLPSALVIAFLAAIESLLSAMVADRMIGSKHRSNAEILAQGYANIGSALFGGMPATGAIARTATNIRAGGKTPVAGIVHALLIFAIMAVAAPLAGHMAMPALAGLLLITAWNMSEPHKWGGYWASPVAERILLIMTMLLTIFTDLAFAIGVGVAFGLAIRLRRRNVPPADWSTPER